MARVKVKPTMEESWVKINKDKVKRYRVSEREFSLANLEDEKEKIEIRLAEINKILDQI